jgi:tetratricopeptide (TPR) repeat protein
MHGYGRVRACLDIHTHTHECINLLICAPLQAIYFLTKALDVASMAQDIEREANVNQMLGLAHERMGNLHTAIEFHEKHRSLVVRAHKDLPAEGGRHLIGAYKALAEELQRQGDYVGAISYYERSLDVAAKVVSVCMCACLCAYVYIYIYIYI